MQKVFKLISIILFIVIILLLAVGILSGFETDTKVSITIDAPRNVTWKRIIDYGEYSKWFFSGAKIISNDAIPLQRNSVLTVYPAMGTGTISTEYKILEYLPEKKITVRNLGKMQIPLVRDKIITIELKSLPDGSSEVSWLETYSVKTFIGKIFNQLYYRHYKKTIAVNALRQLKRLIETY